MSHAGMVMVFAVEVSAWAVEQVVMKCRPEEPAAEENRATADGTPVVSTAMVVFWATVTFLPETSPSAMVKSAVVRATTARAVAAVQAARFAGLEV